MTTVRTIAFALFPLVYAPASWSDTITLENGRQLQGIVVEESESSMVVKLDTGSQITLPKTGIQGVIRSDTSELRVLEGDSHFKKKDYEKAHEAYWEASQQGSAEAEAKLRDLERELTTQIEESLADLPLDDAEARLRGELAKTPESSPYHPLYRRELGNVLSAKGRRAMGNHAPKPAREFFGEAWSLDPEASDFGEDYFEALVASKVSDEAIARFLSDYTTRHPGNALLTQELALRIWEENPCEAADLMVSLGTPRDTGIPDLNRALPRIFKGCFESKSSSELSSLPRSEYYEIYLELEPTADRSPLFEAWLETDPQDENQYRDYAAYLIEHHRSEEAAGVYHRLLEVNPNSAEAVQFLRDWETQKDKIAFEEEVARIEELERSYQAAADLTVEDFPLVGDPAEVEELIKTARELSTVLEKRPEAMGGEPSKEALRALNVYRQELEAEQEVEALKRLLSRTAHKGATPTVGDKAPDFFATGLNGETVSLSQYSGKVVLMFFWATWCPACREEAPNVAETHAALKEKDFRVIGFSMDRDRSQLIDYLQAHRNANWPQVFEGARWENPVGATYGVSSIPTTILIDRQGTIRFMNVRGRDLFNAVLELLSEVPKPPSRAVSLEETLTRP